MYKLCLAARFQQTYVLPLTLVASPIRQKITRAHRVRKRLHETDANCSLTHWRSRINTQQNYKKLNPNKRRRQFLVNVYGFLLGCSLEVRGPEYGSAIQRTRQNCRFKVVSSIRWTTGTAFKYLVMPALLKARCFLYPSFYTFLSDSKTDDLTNTRRCPWWCIWNYWNRLALNAINDDWIVTTLHVTSAIVVPLTG